MSIKSYQKKILHIEREEKKLQKVRAYSAEHSNGFAFYSSALPRKRKDSSSQLDEYKKLQKEIEELKQRKNKEELGDNDFDRMAVK